MQDLICQAIKEKRLLELQYEGQARRVAPHIYGIDAAGDEVLSCYEVWGGSDGEPAGWRSLQTRANLGADAYDQALCAAAGTSAHRRYDRPRLLPGLDQVSW